MTEQPDTVDLIKLDTEGTEHLILRGAEELLHRHQPILICETLFNVIEGDLERIMKQYNYRFFNYMDGRLYETDTLIRKADNGVRDCFFCSGLKSRFDCGICPWTIVDRLTEVNRQVDPAVFLPIQLSVVSWNIE